ncbi:MAG: endoribonuclease MazF [Candidatus Marinimicrobia bacterium]|nr:endoribonuclease MazF [Candidatus Neomarinimicrobiota bacterium]MCF7828775.1 endoribonuclease MazF [Candidatus Neomarinimicrobiota bacterium]MCF7880692.1 endoribonuclease MazF [Candidatus Neomarinimicrobiota bacterium]
MVAKQYVPDCGDLIWLELSPQTGHEQSGHHPAIVVSPKSYNAKVGLTICCPITNQQKGYPFEVVLPKSTQATGVILSDQVKSLDWKKRQAQFMEKAPDSVLNETLGKIHTLL